MTKSRKVDSMAAEDQVVRRVVVADDDYLVRMIVRAVLEGEGFEVIEAGNGETAVAENARHRPDLVLIDAHMPGATLAQSLAALLAGRDAHGAPGIVVITGDLTRPIEASEPTIGFLSKPVDLQVLLDTVAQYAVPAATKSPRPE